MAAEDRRRVVRWALIAGALFIIGIGVYLALGVTPFGWAVVAFGILDLAAVPFWMRSIRVGGAPPSVAKPESADVSPAEAPAEAPDPSYNPYARED